MEWKDKVECPRKMLKFLLTGVRSSVGGLIYSDQRGRGPGVERRVSRVRNRPALSFFVSRWASLSVRAPLASPREVTFAGVGNFFVGCLAAVAPFVTFAVGVKT